MSIHHGKNEPLKESDVPVFDNEEQGEGHGLSVLVDGQPGRVFIFHPAHSGSKIVFQFEKRHPNLKFKKYFKTKYFRFLGSGHIEWGHDGHTLKVYRCG